MTFQKHPLFFNAGLKEVGQTFQNDEKNTKIL